MIKKERIYILSSFFMNILLSVGSFYAVSLYLKKATSLSSTMDFIFLLLLFIMAIVLNLFYLFIFCKKEKKFQRLYIFIPLFTYLISSILLFIGVIV